MAKISYSHEIIERRDFGKEKVRQEMTITVNYDPRDGYEDVHAVDVYQNGVHVAEISKLLCKAEGNPLITMIEAIDWDQVYSEQKNEVSEYENDMHK